VTRICEDTGTITISAAIRAFLATISRPESRGTHRQYAATLRRFRDHFGADTPLGESGDEEVRAWIDHTWGQRAPATYNRALDVFRSAFGYWAAQGWCAADPARSLPRRHILSDQAQPLSRADIETLLSRDDVGLREKTLWRMLYETAARAGEILALNIEDLDLANCRAKVRRKGGAIDIIVWQTGTARLLPRLIKGRTSGPVFLTDRRARVPLAAADTDRATGRARLSYRRAAELFEAATRDQQGRHATLHQLRHTALTHDAEAGASTAVLMAHSGHTSTRSLARYAQVSADALQRWQEDRDPTRRD
jgi:integrase